ncbi:tRNA (5-methylaminomethyl-2-thiouridine)(34)-methyltransferase MnmD [Ampullimonas aquatilis]|uniref:tRNA (5-methylaminomethyl-2-thiouridine)(34)-methyltransferase MnmD n=1 Tax=Ampullimonas aquatilis TaxID=1341549 RepID=UPI003C754347
MPNISFRLMAEWQFFSCDNQQMLELCPDGSYTAYSTRFAQHYHNRHGAFSQARHVYLLGSETQLHPHPQVLEIGFGVGMNFLTTLCDALTRGVSLQYRAFEFDPLPVSVLRAIGEQHPAMHALGKVNLWEALLQAWSNQTEIKAVPWRERDAMDKQQEIAINQANRKAALAARVNETSDQLPHYAPIDITLDQHHLHIDWCDVTAVDAPLPLDWASAVYLDGFSPDTNPEVWTPQFIERLVASMQVGSWMTTYSSAGAVRRAMKAAGLTARRRPGIAGKREHVHGQKLPV